MVKPSKKMENGSSDCLNYHTGAPVVIIAEDVTCYSIRTYLVGITQKCGKKLAQKNRHSNSLISAA